MQSVLLSDHLLCLIKAGTIRCVILLQAGNRSGIHHLRGFGIQTGQLLYFLDLSDKGRSNIMNATVFTTTTDHAHYLSFDIKQWGPAES